MQLYTHVYSNTTTCMFPHMHGPAQMDVKACVNTYIYIYIYIYIYVCVCVCVCMCVCVCVCGVCVCVKVNMDLNPAV